MQPLGTAAVSRLSSEELSVEPNIGEIMRYVCFGYFDEEAWAAMPTTDQEHFMDECLAYDDVLRNNGPIGGEALQTVRNNQDIAPSKREGDDHRRPVRRNQRTDRWILLV